jgi:hypothetical protein
MTGRWLRALTIVLVLGGEAAAAWAADDGPRLPCGTAPYPAFAEPGAPPNVRAWRGKAAQGWTPPSCIGWAPKDADMLVALAGSFRLDGEIDAVLVRLGAISAKKAVRYWSTTEKEWKPLVTDAHALGSADPASKRGDFAPAQWVAGQSLYYAQSDNRTAGTCVYREFVRSVDRDRVIVETDNVSPLKKMMVTLFEPGAMQTAYVIERRAPGVWNFYSLTRTRMASALLPTGGEGSYINRSAAFFRYVAGIPTDQEPPAAR